MTYSGSAQVAKSRQLLGQALEALQQDPNIPKDVLQVAENIAAAVGALFEAERASSEVDGKSSVKHAMGSLSQTMALLQDVNAKEQAATTATKHIAEALSKLYPLASTPSVRPTAASAEAAPQRKPTSGQRESLEANVGATTESNFFVGFSGEISEGGVFVATYLTLPLGTAVEVLVTLPGGYEKKIPGTVRFVRDPMDMDSEPGIGVGFDRLDRDARELILRFIRKRAPMFFDL